MMSKKTLTTSITLIVSLALVSTFGSGVAWAHGGHGQSGAVVHGRTDGGHARIDGNLDQGASGGTNTKGKTNVGGAAVAPDTNVKGGAKIDGDRDGRTGSPVSLTGSITCAVHGKMSFRPALVNGGTASSTVTVTGLLSRCNKGRQGKVKFNNGHLSALVGTVATNDCAILSAGVAPALSGGSIKWTPTSKVAASSNLSVPAGSGSIVTSGAKSEIEIAYSGGSVGGGSFSNTGGSSVMVTSTQATTAISGRCPTGLANVTFSGTVTL